MGPLAEVAQDAGYEVSGSDLHESLVSLELEKRGVDVVYEQSIENITAVHTIKPIDWLVYTSALAGTHPELEFARKHGIKVSKRDEFLADFIKEKNLELIAIAGTHGKTTTTGMFVWAAQQLGLPVSYSIGTTVSFGPSGRFNEKAKYLIYECDEYDRNFLQFFPKIAILPSVDYDHADIYKTVDDYKSAFRQFIDQSEQTIMFKNTHEYLQPLNDENVVVIDHRPDQNEINLAGQMRRNDAYLVAQAIKLIGDFDESKIYEVLGQFPGTNRRFEQLSDRIYTDYAHHPAEIAATVQMAAEVNPNVIAIYQPHQNMRQHSLIDEYKNVFDGAKHVYWLPTYQPSGDREKNDVLLTPSDLISKLSNPEIAEPAELNDELWDTILAHHSTGDLIILMSAGDADEWLRKKVIS